MIKKIDEISEFNSFSKTDIYSIRIKSLLEAYSTKYDFATFFKQLNDEGEITAIISKLDFDITVSCFDDCDALELSSFFESIKFNSILCDKNLFLPYQFETGSVMKSSRKIECEKRYVTIDDYPKLMDLYNFEDYDNVDFEAWYVDMSHRIRHNCAKAYALTVNNEIISSAIFTSIYNDNAILSSVKTQSDFQRMGYGSALVSNMICDIKGDVYLMREQNKNKEFYTKLGFKNVGTWRLYK